MTKKIQRYDCKAIEPGRIEMTKTDDVLEGLCFGEDVVVVEKERDELKAENERLKAVNKKLEMEAKGMACILCGNDADDETNVDADGEGPYCDTCFDDLGE